MAQKRIARRPRRQQNAIQRYYRETVGELRKVSWPTRREATNLTIIVLIVVTVMTFILGGLDAIFSALLEVILGY